MPRLLESVLELGKAMISPAKKMTSFLQKPVIADTPSEMGGTSWALPSPSTMKCPGVHCDIDKLYQCFRTLSLSLSSSLSVFPLLSLFSPSSSSPANPSGPRGPWVARHMQLQPAAWDALCRGGTTELLLLCSRSARWGFDAPSTLYLKMLAITLKM